MKTHFMKIIKNITYTVLAVFMFFSCENVEQSKEASEENATEEVDTVRNTELSETESESKSDSISFERLIIQGHDIWLRDEPATGEVILKLNTGDTCEILELGIFEIINGQADFWYRVKYKEQEAWVFGSQSDIKLGLKEPETADEVWKLFKKAQKIRCRRFTTYFTDQSDYDRGIICRISEEKADGLSLNLPCDECAKRVTYSVGKLGSEHLIIRGREFLGGAMGCYSNFSKQAFKDNGKWNMRLADDLNGRVDTSFSMNSGREFTVVISERDCGITGEYALSIYETERKNRTKSKKVQELFSQNWNTQNGRPYIDSVGVDYEFTEDKQKLILTKYRKHPDGSDLDNLTIRFRRDAASGRFITE
jgi:hypothetical protein